MNATTAVHEAKPSKAKKKPLSSGFLFSLALIMMAAMKVSFMIGQHYAGGASSSHHQLRLIKDLLPLQSFLHDAAILVLSSKSSSASDERREGYHHRSSIENHQHGNFHGRHLLVDIVNVSSDFLGSELSLSNAIANLAEPMQKDGDGNVVDELVVLLSHRCHSGSNKSMGIVVSCVGVFVDSHVLVHAWPAENKVHISFFTTSSSSSSLDSSLIPSIQKAFAAPRLLDLGGTDTSIPRLHSTRKKQRHFEIGPENASIKKNETLAASLQHVDDENQDDDDDEADVAYYEALVHPAMLVHPNPRRVAIIVGNINSTSAVVREVLKHNTVEECFVIVGLEEHAAALDFASSRKSADCCDLVGCSSPSCLDDVRVQVKSELDASAWFMEHFSEADEIGERDKFDVIIMDSIDQFSFSQNDDDDASDSGEVFSNALTEDGVLVADYGIANKLNDPRWNHHYNTPNRWDMVQTLSHTPLKAMKVYTETKHIGSYASLRSFLIAFRSLYSKNAWYRNEAEFDLALEERMVQTLSGDGPLRNFDGPTMMAYQFPSRIDEEVYCRTVGSSNNTAPDAECADDHGFDPEIPNAPITAFEVKPSSILGAGRGVFYKEDFQSGTYIAMENAVHALNVMPSAYSLIFDMEEDSSPGSDLWEPIESYMSGYGYDYSFYGDTSNVVDPGIITFVNHGCDGSNNVGLKMNVTEMNADVNVVPYDIEIDNAFEDHFFNPYFDRHHWSLMSAHDTTSVDVKAGDEVLDNYLTFYANWSEAVTELRPECQGIATGTVVDYEKSRRDEKEARLLDS